MSCPNAVRYPFRFAKEPCSQDGKYEHYKCTDEVNGRSGKTEKVIEKRHLCNDKCEDCELTFVRPDGTDLRHVVSGECLHSGNISWSYSCQYPVRHTEGKGSVGMPDKSRWETQHDGEL